MRLASLLLLLGLLGCPSNPYDEDGCAPSDAPTLRIGTGELAYEPLETGGSLRVEYGPQGGQHLVLAFEATGLNVENNPADFEAEVAVAEERVAALFNVLEVKCDASRGVLVTRGAYAVFERDPGDLIGADALVTATVRDVDGREAQASLAVLLTDQ